MGAPSTHSLVLTDALFESAPGGSRLVVRELTAHLAARGHHITILVPRWSASDPAAIDYNGISIRRYGAGRGGLRGLPDLLIEGRRNLNVLLRDNRKPFDVLHAHFAYSHLPGMLPLAQHVAHVTVRSFYGPWAVEGQVEQESPGRHGLAVAISTRARFQARSFVEQRSLNHADRLIALSDYSVHQLTTMYGVPRATISVIPGGVNQRRFTLPSLPKAAVRRRLGLPPDGDLVLTVRRLAARMGLDNLISAMPVVLRAMPNAQLVIVGQGPLQAQLEAQVQRLGLSRCVRFAGFIPDDDLPLYYQAADLFVVPTRSLEGFGLITLEAFASGVPVVGTPVGATPELLRLVDDRLIMDSAEPQGIADGIVRYFTHVAGQLHPTALRELVLARYTWETVAAQTEALYLQTLMDLRRVRDSRVSVSR